MEVFLALDIPPFVMYCVNGKPRSSLFIESTDSMITNKNILQKMKSDVRLMINSDIAEKRMKMKALKCKPSAQFTYNYSINVLSKCSNVILH